MRGVSLAAVSAIIAALALTNDVVVNWFRTGTAEPPVHYEVALQPLTDGKVQVFEEVGRDGVKVDMLLHNNSVPDREMHNVVGTIWADGEHLIGTFKQYGVVYRERREGGRVEFDLQFPVLSKMSHSWLSAWTFRLPAPGQVAQFGAQIVSAESDYRQYRWTLVNENGKGVVRGGDDRPPGINRR